MQVSAASSTGSAVGIQRRFLIYQIHSQITDQSPIPSVLLIMYVVAWEVKLYCKRLPYIGSLNFQALHKAVSLGLFFCRSNLFFSKHSRISFFLNLDIYQFHWLNMESPAKKPRQLLADDSSSDSGEEGGGVSIGDQFKINDDYARRFEHNKKREELQKRTTV